jgi:competence protein ComEA
MNDSIFAAIFTSYRRIHCYLIETGKTDSGQIPIKQRNKFQLLHNAIKLKRIWRIYGKIQKLNSYKESNGSSEPVFTPVELNSADSTDLVELYGIGPVFANRILKYRDLLGGFYSVNQLLEVIISRRKLFEKLKTVFPLTLCF